MIIKEVEKAQLQTVNKHTRAGKKGKLIICPECYASAIIYHFSFSAIACQNCSEMIDKYELYVFKKGNSKIENYYLSK